MPINHAAVTHRRELSGLNKKALSAAAGISPSYLTELEQGKYPGCSPEVIKRLAQALDCTIGDLLHQPEPVA